MHVVTSRYRTALIRIRALNHTIQHVGKVTDCLWLINGFLRCITNSHTPYLCLDAVYSCSWLSSISELRGSFRRHFVLDHKKNARHTWSTHHMTSSQSQDSQGPQCTWSVRSLLDRQWLTGVPRILNWRQSSMKPGRWGLSFQNHKWRLLLHQAHTCNWQLNIYLRQGSVVILCSVARHVWLQVHMILFLRIFPSLFPLTPVQWSSQALYLHHLKDISQQTCDPRIHL